MADTTAEAVTPVSDDEIERMVQERLAQREQERERTQIGETQRAALEQGRPYVQRLPDGTYEDLNSAERLGKIPELQGDPEPEMDWENPKIVRRSDAKSARAKEAEGVLMELPYTGGFARVQLLELADKNSLGWVPTHLQATLSRAFDAVAPTPGQKSKDPNEGFARLMKQAADMGELADAFCVRGFLDPHLVATEGEVPGDDDSVLCVTDLHINERIGYLSRCMPADREIRMLDPFRRQPIPTPLNKQSNQARPASQRVVGIR